ncbi:MAG TPA: ribokinase [Mycobacteriales bacterium]|nr:ribokinase [Mycobacteriales bacterium]
MTLRACVVGSTNVDRVLRVAVLPSPGQTVLAAGATREPGGKGGNQAVALARLGAAVSLVSAVGSDAEGMWSLDVLRAEGVDTQCVDVADAPTGLAVVVVDTSGENTIVVSPGANAHVQPPDALEADVVLLSLEVPLETVMRTAALARERGVPVVLNAAPARELPASLLELVDVLVVNEQEWEAVGRPALDRVVVTLGSAGCRVQEGGRHEHLPAVPVAAVDTTGAGDCFAAALAYGIGSGWELMRSAELAVRAAAAAVTSPGARGGLPRHDDLL